MALRERLQQVARDAIVTAAFELFAERGYASVTVADIAKRAEVGRTTFFRYFGDKQEVVFANEQQWLSGLSDRHREASAGKPPTLQQALVSLRTTAASICAQATQDPKRYRVREQLLQDNPELNDRAGRKHRLFAATISGTLRDQGVSAETAALAAQLAVACYNTGRELAGTDPAALGPAVDAAFARLRITGS
jgi:AcrR family transcriptional regulator